MSVLKLSSRERETGRQSHAEFTGCPRNQLKEILMSSFFWLLNYETTRELLLKLENRTMKCYLICITIGLFLWLLLNIRKFTVRKVD